MNTTSDNPDYRTDEDSLKQRIARLGSPDLDLDMFLQGAHELSLFGEPAIPYLIAALHNADTWFGAAEALAMMGEIAVASLIPLLNENLLGNLACHALTRMGEPAVLPLIAALHDKRWGVRAWAATILGSIGDARAIEPLRAVWADESSEVRYWARRALEEMGVSV